MSAAETERPLWSPGRSDGSASNLELFTDHVRATRGLDIDEYHSLWEWSVAEIGDFWSAI